MLVRSEVEGSKPGLSAETHVSYVPSAEKRCDIASIRGFDFFPQTGHVEGVAILLARLANSNPDVSHLGSVTTTFGSVFT